MKYRRNNRYFTRDDFHSQACWSHTVAHGHLFELIKSPAIAKVEGKCTVMSVKVGRVRYDRKNWEQGELRRELHVPRSMSHRQYRLYARLDEKKQTTNLKFQFFGLRNLRAIVACSVGWHL